MPARPARRWSGLHGGGRQKIGFDFALSPMAKNLVGMLHHFESRSTVV